MSNDRDYYAEIRDYYAEIRDIVEDWLCEDTAGKSYIAAQLKAIVDDAEVSDD